MPKQKSKEDKKARKTLKKMKKEAKRNDERYGLFKMLAIRLFGNMADKYTDYFIGVKESLLKADLKILYRTYLSIMFFLVFVVFLLSFSLTIFLSVYLQVNILLAFAGSLLLSVSFSAIAFLLYYAYPMTLSQRRKSDIESNLPFAINHMAAIAGAGVPPRAIFKVISRFKEYGEISTESKKINRNIEIFGMDEITSIKDVISKTPSVEFKDFLQGIISTILTGGNLKNYLNEEAEKALFEYRINRNNYIQQLSIYADFYTALLIAAPLVLVVMLPVLGVMQGSMFGFTLTEIINMGLVILAVLNVLFIMFLELTQKKM